MSSVEESVVHVLLKVSDGERRVLLEKFNGKGAVGRVENYHDEWLYVVRLVSRWPLRLGYALQSRQISMAAYVTEPPRDKQFRKSPCLSGGVFQHQPTSLPQVHCGSANEGGKILQPGRAAGQCTERLMPQRGIIRAPDRRPPRRADCSRSNQIAGRAKRLEPVAQQKSHIAYARAPQRWLLAIASAASERSVAVTYHPRRSQARARAMAPEPVPRSAAAALSLPHKARQRSTTSSVSGRGTSTAGETRRSERPKFAAAHDIGKRFARGAPHHQLLEVGKLCPRGLSSSPRIIRSLRERPSTWPSRTCASSMALVSGLQAAHRACQDRVHRGWGSLCCHAK